MSGLRFHFARGDLPRKKRGYQLQRLLWLLDNWRVAGALGHFEAAAGDLLVTLG